MPRYEIDPRDVYADIATASNNRVVLFGLYLVDSDNGTILDDTTIVNILEFIGSPDRVTANTLTILDKSIKLPNRI